jgi:predicted RNA binding protein YcfA (HicA-like mRNA interferase family)
MSQHLPALKPTDVIRALKRAGCPPPIIRVTLPFQSRDLRRRTLTSIIDQAGMSIGEFLKLL